MIPRCMSSGYVRRPIIDMQRSTHHRGTKGIGQKFGRLKREAKKHSQNCYKRQKIMLELQDMIYSR